nr:hypothetical protein [Pallidibacillus pasinlerensis]
MKCFLKSCSNGSITIELPPFFFISGTAARIPKNFPVVLTSITFSKSSREYPVISVLKLPRIPALLIKISTFPKRFTVSETTVSQSSSEATLCFNPSTPSEPISSLIDFIVCSSNS